MNDFQGLLSSDFVFKPQGKDAPMAPPRSSPNTNAAANSPAFDFDIDIGGLKNSSFPKSSSSFSSSAAFLDDHDTLFRQSNSASPHRKPNDFGNLGVYDDIFGGNSRSSKSSSVNLDSIFSGGLGETEPRFSSLPVFDKPVYDDDMFDGVSGPKTPISAKYEDKISSSSSSSHPPPHSSAREHDAFDELLGGLGRKQSELKGSRGSGSHMSEKLTSGFDDLLPGFGPVGDRYKLF